MSAISERNLDIAAKFRATLRLHIGFWTVEALAKEYVLKVGTIQHIIRSMASKDRVGSPAVNRSRPMQQG